MDLNWLPRIVQRARYIRQNQGFVNLVVSIADFLKYNFILYSDHLHSKINYEVYKLRFGGSIAEPYKIIYINPQEVNWIKVPSFYMSYSKCGTYVRGGNWDQQYSNDTLAISRNKERKLVHFDNYTFYQSIHRWINKDVDWNNTRSYKILADNKSKEIAKKKGNKLKKIRDSILENGYLTQRELEQNNEDWVHTPLGLPPEQNEIIVDIGRDGEMIFDDGRHRFCIAKALDLEKVPVRVLVRHRDWQLFRKKIHRLKNTDEFRSDTQQYVDHPDILEI